MLDKAWKVVITCPRSFGKHSTLLLRQCRGNYPPGFHPPCDFIINSTLVVHDRVELAWPGATSQGGGER